MTYTLDKVRILVVDDMRPMLTLIKEILQILGFQHIDTATNGEKAYELLRKNDHDLVITDWQMSPMDGLALCEMIRRNPMTPNPYVPIILMTGYGSKEKVESARDIGTTEFLSKPFTPQDLFKRIEQVIEFPRDFVDANDFFGPDRRRRKNTSYDGPNRRDRE